METFFNLLNYLNFDTSSYRTYEEWKLVAYLYLSIAQRVLTVPMRNGNRRKCKEAKGLTNGSYRTYEEWKHNKAINNTTKYEFLPYLWGMETNVLHTQTRKDKKFLPYLWGMETDNNETGE